MNINKFAHEQQKQIQKIFTKLTEGSLSQKDYLSTQQGFFVNDENKYPFEVGHEVGHEVLPELPQALNRGIQLLYKIIGNPKNRAGVISFTIKGIHPHDISTIVDENGVAIRAGHHCCQILHERLNLTATARASIGIYNTKEDIDVLCAAIENCRKVFELR